MPLQKILQEKQAYLLKAHITVLRCCAIDWGQSQRQLTMALNNPLYTRHLFQCVNVLRVIAQKLLLLIQHGYEFVTGRWLELTGVDLLQWTHEVKAQSYSYNIADKIDCSHHHTDQK